MPQPILHWDFIWYVREIAGTDDPDDPRSWEEKQRVEKAAAEQIASGFIIYASAAEGLGKYPA